ncbi:MAG: polysaccharide biosynthesis protein, partial [Pseudomonadota bacterium]|nr:polysaccharide biosynthesis protein [Pseudomonadota bacterium]
MTAAVIDLLLVLLAWGMAFWLRFNLDVPADFQSLALESAPLSVLAYALGLSIARVYRQVWSYTGLPELRQLAVGVAFSAVLCTAFVLMLRLPGFPRSVVLLHPLIALVLLGAARAASRTVAERRLADQARGRPLVIVGSLADASDALRALKGSHQWQPVAIVSPIAAEVGRAIQDIPVLGTIGSLGTVCSASGARTALVASPPGSEDRRQALLDTAGVTLLTMPRPDEWLKTQAAGPRSIELEDLLGRAAVQLDVAGLAELFSGQTVLVTGAGGSIGAELCRQIARFGVGRLVCVDVSEYAIYQLEQELREAHPQMHGVYY